MCDRLDCANPPSLAPRVRYFHGTHSFFMICGVKVCEACAKTMKLIDVESREMREATLESLRARNLAIPEFARTKLEWIALESSDFIEFESVIAEKRKEANA